MAERYDELRSIGPESVGSGTIYDYDRLNPSRTRGIISRFIDGGVDVASDLPSLARNEFPLTYPGDATLPLRKVRIRLFENGQALAIARYTSGGNAGRWTRRLRMGSASRSATTYKYPAGWSEDEIPKEEDPEDGKLYYAPRQIEVPQRHIEWRDSIYGDARPDIPSLVEGTINNNSYIIDGYGFAAGTLRFEGFGLLHEKLGGADRWWRTYAATYDSQSWMTGALDKSGGVPGTPVARQLYPDSFYTTWPDLP